LAAVWEQATVEKIDDQTVRVTLKEPYAPFLQATTLGLLPAHLLSGVDPQALLIDRHSTLEPIGTGPYRLAQPGGVGTAEIKLERFAEHFATSKTQPYVDGLVFRIFDTKAAAVQALAQHEVQTMGDVPPDAFAALDKDASLYSVGRPSFTLLYLNPTNALFSDRAVRQAMSRGLDRAGIVNDLLLGQGIAAASPIAPGSWAHDPGVAAAAVDLASAGRILADAGWIDSDGNGTRDRDGRNLSFTLATTRNPLLIAVAERIRSDWLGLGIDATVQTLDQQTTVSSLTNRAFDALLFGWERDDYDPDPYPLWHSSRAADGQNYSGWRDPVADALMVEARQVGPDRIDERAALYYRFQRRFVEEEPALVLYHPVYTYVVVDPNLGGVQLPALLVKPADRFVTLRDWYVRTERVLRRPGQ